MSSGSNTTSWRGKAALALALACSAFGASAQIQRLFPPTALRGTLVVGQTPEMSLNGRPARLGPGSRIRNADNFIELPGALAGRPLLVNYVPGLSGEVLDVWILTPDEAARRPWPTTPEEAARWLFDYPTQTWTRQ